MCPPAAPHSQHNPTPSPCCAFSGQRWPSEMNGDVFKRSCQTNANKHRIAGAALIYALNSWRHSVRAAVRLILKLSRE